MWVGIIWSAICAIGLGYYLALYARARGDVAFLRKHGINHVRLIYARMRARFYFSLATIQSLYVIVGILYIVDPNLHLNANGHGGIALTIVRSLFFVAAIILAILAIYTERLRSTLVDTIRIPEKTEGEGIDDGNS